MEISGPIRWREYAYTAASDYWTGEVSVGNRVQLNQPLPPSSEHRWDWTQYLISIDASLKTGDKVWGRLWKEDVTDNIQQLLFESSPPSSGCKFVH